MGILRVPYRTRSSPDVREQHCGKASCVLIGDPRLRIAGMTISSAITIAFISYLFISLLFSRALRIQNDELEGKRVHLKEAEMLVARKPDYQKDWESKKSVLPTHFSDDHLLNLWVKDLLSYASSEGLTFTKLEPQGVRMGEGENGGKGELRLYLEFQGDVRKLIRFLYYLSEKDPLSRMDSLSIKKEEGIKNFSYQMTLRRIVL